jgi:KipI family sensor histidine kinase inhibitor
MSGEWPRVSRLGEETWLVELEPRLDVAINAHAHRIAGIVEASGISGIRDVVPGMASVAVHVDADRTDAHALESLLRACMVPTSEAPIGGARHELPVCYEPPYALDIADVATRCGCAVEDVIDWHSAIEYRVFMIGFLPGFPYLGIVDSRLALPRRETPRLRVPTGSVGIAGLQTGVYPSESPGGWHIIGRTPVALFDSSATPPSRLAPGDRIRFVPVSADRFARLRANSGEAVP